MLMKPLYYSQKDLSQHFNVHNPTKCKLCHSVLGVLYRQTQTRHEKAVRLYLCPRTWIANKFSRHQHNDLIETQPLAVGRNISLHREMPALEAKSHLASPHSKALLESKTDPQKNMRELRYAAKPYPHPPS